MKHRFKNSTWLTILALAALAAPPLAMAQAESNTVAISAKTSATALKIEGLPNAYKVSDTLYRGAQPTADGFKELKKLGIKTVICLRSFHSDEKLIAGTGLAYESIPINTWDMEGDYVIKFLKSATDTNKTPVFVHCQHGADRTGTMCALYRITVSGWTKDAAIKEMTDGGFGFHSTWQNLITFIKDINIEDIKKKAGLEAAKGAQTP